jgi:hypothetical protein
LNFQDAEKTYRDLKQQHAAEKLTDEDFEAEVAKLSHQDAQGHWWQLGVETGEWYMHDGQQWNKAKPPIAPVAPAAPPPAPVPPAAPVTPAAPTSTRVPPVASTPAPVASASQKDTRDSVLPARRRRVAPAGSGDGNRLPTPTLIGIIAFVAVVALLFVVGGCFVINAMLGGIATARATTTPTRLPTLTVQVPTDTPLPPPTIEVTATEQVTPTLAAAKPTATKKPAPTPTGPTATATLNVPPGVYVTNIETIPAKVNLGDTIGFKVSFLNTTGSIQTYNWYVKWYQCPEQCQDFKHSQGETLQMNSNVAPGTSSLSTSQNITLRTGISCDLIAIANYVDPVNQLPTPFQATKDNGHFSFTPCQ